jgi:hypothetical protein
MTIVDGTRLGMLMRINRQDAKTAKKKIREKAARDNEKPAL